MIFQRPLMLVSSWYWLKVRDNEKYSKLGSCVPKALTVECQSIPLIDTQIGIQQLTYWYRHSINIPMAIQLTLDQQSVDSQLSVNRLIFINQKLLHCWPRCQWSVSGVPTEESMECQSSIEWGYRLKVLIKVINWSYWSRVPINSWQWMPLVLTIHKYKILRIKWRENI